MAGDIAGGNADAVVREHYEVEIVSAGLIRGKRGAGEIESFHLRGRHAIKLLLHGAREVHLKLLFLQLPQLRHILDDGDVMGDFPGRSLIGVIVCSAKNISPFFLRLAIVSRKTLPDRMVSHSFS